jgi:hypothetical protein
MVTEWRRKWAFPIGWYCVGRCVGVSSWLVVTWAFPPGWLLRGRFLLAGCYVGVSSWLVVTWAFPPGWLLRGCSLLAGCYVGVPSWLVVVGISCDTKCIRLQKLSDYQVTLTMV